MNISGSMFVVPSPAILRTLCMHETCNACQNAPMNTPLGARLRYLHLLYSSHRACAKLAFRRGSQNNYLALS